jgi:peroxiredoxin
MAHRAPLKSCDFDGQAARLIAQIPDIDGNICGTQKTRNDLRKKQEMT